MINHNLMAKLRGHNKNYSTLPEVAKSTNTKYHPHMVYELIIDPFDKTNLKAYMREELNSYNYLIENLTAKVRCNPEQLSIYVRDWETLYGHVAFNSIDVYKLWMFEGKSKSPSIPESLEKFKSLFIDDFGKFILNEANANILSVPGKKFTFHPKMKRLQALEALKYHREQFAPSLKGSKTSPAKNNTEFLELLDDNRKRHVQLTRDLMEIRYENENSYIKIPYARSPIVVKGVNLNELESTWNYAIIHQEPGKLPASLSPWQIELKSVSSYYLIKYLDNTNPYVYTSFNSAKPRRYN